MRTKLILLTAAALAACSPTELDDRWSNPENITYASSLEIQLAEMNREASGLYWQDVVEGSGAPAAIDDMVRLHATGWLPDGTLFETTRDAENKPLGPNPLGYGLFRPAGLEQGVIGMRPGGKRKLVVPPALAWGRQGISGLVPPLTTVIFLVERCNESGPC